MDVLSTITGYQGDPDNRRYARGNCNRNNADVRQVFSSSAVLDTPTFSSRGLHAVASGWRISPVRTTFEARAGGSLMPSGKVGGQRSGLLQITVRNGAVALSHRVIERTENMLCYLHVIAIPLAFGRLARAETRAHLRLPHLAQVSIEVSNEERRAGARPSSFEDVRNAN